MRSILFVFVSLGLLFAGCNGKPENKTPVGIIQQDTMVNILIDLHTEQSRVGLSNMTSDTAKVAYQNLEEQVFKKHKITRIQFNKSYRYYLKEVEQMDDMYARVVDSLSAKETKAQSESK